MSTARLMTHNDIHMMPEQTIAAMKDNVEWLKKQT
jgi:hypothetical protein